MYMLLFILNLLMIILIVVFTFKSIISTFSNEGIGKNILVILILLMAIVTFSKAMGLCNLASAKYDLFVERGYSIWDILHIDLQAAFFAFFICLLKILSIRKTKKLIEKNRLSEEGLRWEEWMKRIKK